jgi:UTP:GlnB (protein PII) uridylyltransferase
MARGFLLRVPPGLHRALRRTAQAAGLSLNEYCVRKLAAPMGNLASVADAAAAVSHAAGLFGEDLLAVAAFGSWSRGDLRSASDVDLLVVLDERIELTRDLYRRWDAEPLSGGRARSTRTSRTCRLRTAPSRACGARSPSTGSSSSIGTSASPAA